MKKIFRKSLLVSLALLLAISFQSFNVFAEETSTSSATSLSTFLVVFKAESLPDNYQEIIEQAGGSVTYEVPQVGVVEVSTNDPVSFINSLKDSGQVLTMGPSLFDPIDLPEVDGVLEVPEESTSEPQIENIWESEYQWDIKQVTNNGASHDISSGTKDVVVGVIDTGFDFNHPDLKDNIVPGSKTFVPGTTDAWDAHSHGTHVAGTIGANGRMKGIAPNVGLRAYRVFNKGGAKQSWITNAIVSAADDGVDVINMSLGGLRVIGQWFYIDPETGLKHRLDWGNGAASVVAYKRAIQYATNKNATVVVSAGNSALDLSNPTNVTEYYNYLLQKWGYENYEVIGAGFYVPAEIPGVITVSATGGGFGTEDRLAFFSNYGNGAINVGAPGGDIGPDFPNSIPADYYKYLILSTVPTYYEYNTKYTTHRNALALFGPGYAWKAGTSMAAPQVAGVAAAYISHIFETTGTKPTPGAVQSHLQSTAVDTGKSGYDEYYGHGIVNALNALTK